MRIPKKIKIGGLTYEVEITDRLALGSANVSAEIIYTDLIIRVAPAVQSKMEADFIHEVVHGMLVHMGHKDHDEQQVEALAQAIYMVIQDNPEMFRPDDPKTEDGLSCSDR